jgi:hypothetical protein
MKYNITNCAFILSYIACSLYAAFHLIIGILDYRFEFENIYDFLSLAFYLVCIILLISTILNDAMRNISLLVFSIFIIANVLDALFDLVRVENLDFGMADIGGILIFLVFFAISLCGLMTSFIRIWERCKNRDDTEGSIINSKFQDAPSQQD